MPLGGTLKFKEQLPTIEAGWDQTHGQGGCQPSPRTGRLVHFKLIEVNRKIICLSILHHLPPPQKKIWSELKKWSLYRVGIMNHVSLDFPLLIYLKY